MRTKILLSLAFLAWPVLGAELDFKILAKQLDESGIYDKKALADLKKCVITAAKIAQNESISGVSLKSKAKDIEKLTRCKLDPKDVTTAEDGKSTWNFKSCHLTAVVKGDVIQSLTIGEGSALKLKSGIGIGASIRLIRDKYKPLYQTSSYEETAFESARCDIPNRCEFDYPTLFIKADNRSETIKEIKLSRFGAGFCSGN